MATLLGSDIDNVAWNELTAEQFVCVRDRMLEKGLSPGTINVTLSALRGVVRTSYDLGLAELVRFRALREVRNVPSTPSPPGRIATSRELSALLTACARDRSTGGVRDLAMLCALIGSMSRQLL